MPAEQIYVSRMFIATARAMAAPKGRTRERAAARFVYRLLVFDQPTGPRFA
jgi:hypothetical protein